MEYLLKNDELHMVLRHIESKDAAFLMELNNDLEIAKYVVGNPRIVTLQEQIQWIENLKFEINRERFIVEQNELAVGTVIVSDIDQSNLTANLNIKLHQSVRRRGLGKQSVKLALKYCFDALGLACVTAHVLSYNKASIALFESCGFTNEGVLRSRIVKGNSRCDLVSFSIIRNELK